MTLSTAKTSASGWNPRIKLDPDMRTSRIAALFAEALADRLDWASNDERCEAGRWVECGWRVEGGDAHNITADMTAYYAEPDLRLPPTLIEEEVEHYHNGEDVRLSVRASLMSLVTLEFESKPRREAVYRVLIQSVD